jgi:hypothetical protein
MPTACAALENWAEIAKLQPGQPVFRPVDQRQTLARRASPTAASPSCRLGRDTAGLAIASASAVCSIERNS